MGSPSGWRAIRGVRCVHVGARSCSHRRNAHGEQGRPADRRIRGLVEAVPCSGRQRRRALRRYGYQWFVLDIALGKPKGWTVGRLQRMSMAQGGGGQRPFIIPALQLVIAITAGNYLKEDQWVFANKVCFGRLLRCNQ
jgi:hypothetical protein